jgi:hypothetical protein
MHKAPFEGPQALPLFAFDFEVLSSCLLCKAKGMFVYLIDKEDKTKELQGMHDG